MHLAGDTGGVKEIFLPPSLASKCHQVMSLTLQIKKIDDKWRVIDCESIHITPTIGLCDETSDSLLFD